MKKFYLLLTSLFVMSFCITSCSDDEEEIINAGVVNYVFDNYKIISSHEFEVSNNKKGNMLFNRFSCSERYSFLDNDYFCVSDLWDTDITHNKEKKNIFVYKVEEDTIFTVTKKDSTTFNIKFSEVEQKDDKIYTLEFKYENQWGCIYMYPFLYNGERWYSELEKWHFREDNVVE